MTIEERADAYVGHPEEIDEFTSETIKRDAYIRGAKDQKAVDIDKACEIVRNIANKYLGDWEQSCKVEDTFRKAMEIVMKARVKATDRIIEVICVMNREGVAVWEDISGISTNPNQYNSDELEFLDFPEMPITTYNPDYWIRLEHQYAGMAMQGMSEKFFKDYRDYCAGFGEINIDKAKATMKDFADAMADVCYYFAHALVERYKKEEK